MSASPPLLPHITPAIPAERGQRGIRLALTIVLAVGFLLRVITIHWGIERSQYSGFYHPDELKSWSSAVQFPETYLTSSNYLYGTAIQYSVGLLMLPAKWIWAQLLGQKDECELATIVVFRLVDVLLGTASIWLIFLVARRFTDVIGALLAAAFLSVSLFPTLDSALTTLDVPMSCLSTWLLYQAFETSKGWSSRSIFRLGLCSGLLLGTKITGGLYVGAALLWCCWQIVAQRGSREGAGRRWAALGRFVMQWGVVTFVVFVVSTPQVLLSFGEYLEFMRNQKSEWYDKANSSPLGILKAELAVTALAVGLPTLIFASLGAIQLVCERRPGGGLVLISIAATYLFWKGYLAPRFLIPVAPHLCLLAALPCRRGMQTASTPISLLGIASAAVIVCWSAFNCYQGTIQKLNDPRTLASRFIALNVPDNSTIGVATDHNDHWTHHVWRYPRLDLKRLRYQTVLNNPEYVIVTSLELGTMSAALQSPKLLAGQHWASEHRRDWYMNDPPSPKRFLFFKDLLQETAYRRWVVFAPPNTLPIDGAAPTIWIYQRREAAP